VTLVLHLIILHLHVTLGRILVTLNCGDVMVVRSSYRVVNNATTIPFTRVQNRFDKSLIYTTKLGDGKMARDP
jgi:hypothetical protein